MLFNQVTGQKEINLLSGYKTCPATGCKLSVEPEGHVFICKCCSGYLGHISDLTGVLQSEVYVRYAMKAYRNHACCAGCSIEGFCSGVCMGSLEKKYGTLNAVEASSCEVFRSLTERLIEEMLPGSAPHLYFNPQQTLERQVTYADTQV